MRRGKWRRMQALALIDDDADSKTNVCVRVKNGKEEEMGKVKCGQMSAFSLLGAQGCLLRREMYTKGRKRKRDRGKQRGGIK